MLRVPENPPLTTLRDFLLEAGYTSNQLASELGLRHGLHANRHNLPPLLERTSGDAILPLLGRLFFVGWPVAQDLCRKHIPEHLLQLCLDANLVTIEDKSVAPGAILTPFENVLLCAADAPRLRGTNPDIVIGPSSTTGIIAKSLIRTQAENVLDIGTGSGVLSMVAAAYSRDVIGTDINQRAVEFARFTAALNGVTNVAFAAGDAFSPVEGKRFSRVIANPPFFLSAQKKFTYSDSPLELDGFTRKLALEAPAYLQENGVFQMICEWVEVEGEPWQKRLRSWTDTSGCDVFVFLGPTSGPVEYAESRYQEAGSLHTGDTTNLLSERLSYLRGHKVQRVMSGVVTLRKRKGINWFAFMPGDLMTDTGKVIQERLEALTVLSEYNEEQWLQARLRFASDARVIQTRALNENGWELASIEVAKPSGIKDPLVIDLPVLRTVEMFDGSNSLAEIIRKTAEALAVSEAEAKKRCLSLTKRLVQSCFIVPVSPMQSGIQE